MEYEPLRTERIALQMMQVGVTLRESLRYSRDPDAQDWLAGTLAHRLEAYVLSNQTVGDTKTVSKTVKVPNTWWQMLKQDYAPAWFVRRFPVIEAEIPVEVTVRFERYETYPEANIALPRERFGQPFIFERFM